jgi:hypothetical protein
MSAYESILSSIHLDDSGLGDSRAGGEEDFVILEQRLEEVASLHGQLRCLAKEARIGRSIHTLDIRACELLPYNAPTAQLEVIIKALAEAFQRMGSMWKMIPPERVNDVLEAVQLVCHVYLDPARLINYST